MSLTVACVFVRGEYSYTPEYVRRLKIMVDRYIDQPFQFVCLTDQPETMPSGVEPIVIEPFLDTLGCWNKVQLFNPAHGLTGRVLYLDLDSLIVAPLAPIIDFPAVFAITQDALAKPGAKLFDRYDRRVVRRFNSSVMVWDASLHPDYVAPLYLDFIDWPASVVTGDLSTDQDWLGMRLPHDTGELPVAWFPRISRVQPPWPAEAKVILCKKPKCHQAVERWPELKEWWGGWVA